MPGICPAFTEPRSELVALLEEESTDRARRATLGDMIRILGPGGILFVMLLIFTVIDIIASDDLIIRNLPKITWLFIVIIIPLAGIVAWFALGRPVGAGLTPGSTHTGPSRSWMDPAVRERRAPPPRGPEDRDDWRPSTTASTAAEQGSESAAARERRLLEWEAELQRREQALGDDDGESST